jgi:hypothetical protein
MRTGPARARRAAERMVFGDRGDRRCGSPTAVERPRQHGSAGGEGKRGDWSAGLWAGSVIAAALACVECAIDTCSGQGPNLTSGDRCVLTSGFAVRACRSGSYVRVRRLR